VGGRVLIQITPQMRILVAIESIDGRKGIDSLAQLCREKLDADPFSGCLFIFRSRSGKSIRILAYDEQRFWLATTELQRHAEDLKRHPSEWMPWNYRETLARLATPAAA